MAAQNARISSLSAQKTTLGENAKVDGAVQNMLKEEVGRLQKSYDTAMADGKFEEALKIKEQVVEDMKML